MKRRRDFIQRGNLPNEDAIAIRLLTRGFVDLTSFKHLKEDNRAFTVYKWFNNEFSGWQAWLRYSRGEWQKFSDLNFQQAREYIEESYGGKALEPMHKFFKSFEEFEAWVGDEAFQDLIIDLL